jgi:hypothetical protein
VLRHTVEVGQGEELVVLPRSCIFSLEAALTSPIAPFLREAARDEERPDEVILLLYTYVSLSLSISVSRSCRR